MDRDYAIEKRKWSKTNSDPEMYAWGRYVLVKGGFIWTLYFVGSSPNVVDRVDDVLKPPFLWARGKISAIQERRSVGGWSEQKIKGRPGTEGGEVHVPADFGKAKVEA